MGGKHNPVEFANSLNAKLASKSRHICIFLGAGAATSCGLPSMGGLQDAVLSDIEDEYKDILALQLEDQDLEEALSRIRKISTLASDSQRIDGLSDEDAIELDEQICRSIIRNLDTSDADLAPMLNFAAWANHSDYHDPIEVFTTNYDLLIEAGFEAENVPYFDGFVGNLAANFQAELVESTRDNNSGLPAEFTRLWKVHGSVNWVWQQDGIRRLGSPVGSERSPAAIYPSERKYDESRRVPFVVLQDRLRRTLNAGETLAIISGYSFGDDHLNEIIFNAASRNPSSEFIAFCYSGLPDKLIERAQRTPNLQAVGPDEAIIGGRRSEWATPEEPRELVWEDEFLLGDFTNLSSYLSKSSSSEFSDTDRAISDELLKQLSNQFGVGQDE